MSAEHPFSHVSPVTGTPTVFCSVEYPKDSPPDYLEIEGDYFLHVDRDLISDVLKRSKK